MRKGCSCIGVLFFGIMLLVCGLALGLMNPELASLKPRVIGEAEGLGSSWGRGNRGIPPLGGHCSYVGIDLPENPFRGWPMDYEIGKWDIVTSPFCDPERGGRHWGIDLGTPWKRYKVVGTIHRKKAWATARAVVRQAVRCEVPADRSSCWNSGMGQFVQIEALRTEIVETCEEKVMRDLNGDGDWDDCFTEEREVPTGWLATYMHFEEVLVEPGQIVNPGDPLGLIDNTGASTGHHLHYQINKPGPDGKRGIAIDPAPAMRWGVGYETASIGFIPVLSGGRDDRDRLEVVIVDEAGQRVEGVQVALVLYRFDRQGRAFAHPVGECVTDITGRCRFDIPSSAPRDPSGFLRGVVRTPFGNRNVLWPGGELEVTLLIAREKLYVEGDADFDIGPTPPPNLITPPPGSATPAPFWALFVLSLFGLLFWLFWKQS